MAAGAGEAAAAGEPQKDNRPPKYVPSRRDPAAARGVGLRDSLNGGDIASMKKDNSSNY